ncbi:AtuA-related protein [Acuticoccus sp.]|uniref:AtuA-related protein n=1 Tax=Acuticoccus sp. TaxID=1904378 RepID=UPI003B520754
MDEAHEAPPGEASVRVPLHRIAHARSGDKGNRQNISLIAYDPALWPTLLAEVTEARVHELFRHRGASVVRRYVLPKLHAMNFVIDDALEGGVNAALALDTHGKTGSFRLLAMEIAVPERLLPSGG